MRYQIIVNPIAGRGAGERAILLIERYLRQHGLDFEIVRTQRPWHAAELAQQAAINGQFDVVVAAGGDGTVNEVLNGLMLARLSTVAPVSVPPVGKVEAHALAQQPLNVAMGVLGVGRGNDFAYGVGIPKDLQAGCQVLAANYRRMIDVGRVVGGLYPQGRYFGNGVGIGFDAVVGFVSFKMKRLSGFPSYIVAALKTIYLYYQAPLVKIEFNGQAFTQAALIVSVMNGRRMGGGFLMAPDALADDGLLDLCIGRQVSKARIFALIPRFMRGTQADDTAITTGRARRVVVTALQGVLPAHADGETICTDAQQLTVELLPHAIEILCARP